MFTLIKELAELDENNSVDIKDSVDYPGSKKNKDASFILLNLDTQNFKGIAEVEELDPEKVHLYLYPSKGRNRPPNGINKTPTVIFNDYEKSYIKKIFDWFEEYSSKNILYEKIYNILKNNESNLKESISKLNKGNFLSVKIWDKVSNSYKYIGEFEQFINLFLDDEVVVEGISGLKGKPKSILENSSCSVCFDEKKHLYGYAISYNYTFASPLPTFSYGFDEKNAVLQTPVCLDCAKQIIMKGSKYLKDKLNFRFFNTNCFLIPELINKDREKLKTLADKINKYYSEINEKTANLPDKKLGYLIRHQEEKEFLKKLAEEKNYLNYNFFFYQQDQQKFNILASIEEVVPSSLAQLFKSIKVVSDEFKNNDIIIPTNAENNPLYTLKDFVVDRDLKNQEKSKKEFLEVLDKIFNLKPLSYSYLLNKFMDKIQAEIPKYIQGKSDNYFWNNTMNSFFLLNVLANLGLIKFKEGEINMENGNINPKSSLDEFCSMFPDYFDVNDPKYNVKKAVLGYGMLVEQIAYIQTRYYGNTNSKPIYKKFRNFKVDLRFLQNRFEELKAHLEKYKRTTPYNYNALEKLFREISEYSLASNINVLSVKETSYLFVVGLNMAWNYYDKFIKKEEKELVEA